MSDPTFNVPLMSFRDAAQLSAREEADRNLRESEYWDRAFDTPNAPAIQWQDAPNSLSARRKARRRRARACRDVAVGAFSFGLCALLLVGPSLMPLPVYVGLLCAGSAATVLAIALAVRKDNPTW